MTTATETSTVREVCSIVEGQRIDPAGHAVRVTVIRGGLSINGYLYSEEALSEIAQMVEGAHAYADHGEATQVTRSLRDMVGFYTDACYIAPGGGEMQGRVDATLHILEAADWLWSMVREACQLGRPDLIGLSIDIFGHWQHDDVNNAKAVTRILALNSCDIVTRPSAGGSFNRILHAKQHKNHELYQKPLSSKEGSTSTMADKNDTSLQNEAISDERAVVLAQVNADNTKTSSAGGHVASRSGELIQEHSNEQQKQMRDLQQLRQQLEQQIAETKLQRAQLLLELRLRESILPIAVRNDIHARYAGRVFEESELQRDMERSLQMMAQLTRDGVVRGHGYDKVDISSQITEAEKMQAAFDAMMGLDIDRGRLGNIRSFSGIREAYTRITGESSLAAGISSATQVGQIQISESAPIMRISEADVTTANFSYLLGTSMNKRLLKDYQAWPAEWMNFCTIAPIRDFKQQTRVRLGAFGSLPIVAEDSPYVTISLNDSAAVYVPQKRGNIVAVTREAIINDDLQGIKQIPTKLAVAAAYTLAEFVYSFLANNPGIYDSSPLFTSGAPHNNLGAGALSTATMQNGITAMREQTNYGGKRLGLRPRFLVVPPELEWQSMVITKSAGMPGSNNNDINPMLGYVIPIVSPQLSSPTQWFLVGDPREIDTIEIGFVGGQVNPMLFIQDSPLLGTNFGQDVMNFKVRHEYGGVVVDYRGLYRGV